MVDQNEIANVSKSDGKSYHEWKFQMKRALVAKWLFGIVSGTIKKPKKTRKVNPQENMKCGFQIGPKLF